MSRGKEFKRKKNLVKSSFSGKFINPLNVISTREIEEYLKKMGYLVIKLNMKLE